MPTAVAGLECFGESRVFGKVYRAAEVMLLNLSQFEDGL